MKNKWKFNPFFRTAIYLAVLVVMIIVIAIGMYYCVFSIPEPEGLSLANWPNRFTDNFSAWMECENETIRVEEMGLEYLNKYGLWLQVIDETGQEVLAYHKPENYPVSYTSSELIGIKESAYQDGYTVFAGTFEESGETWSYFIGFPYAIGKYMLYYNGEMVARLSPVVRGMVFFVFLAFACLVLCYGFWLSRKSSAITKGIRNITLRTYEPLEEKGIFRDIYAALNKMDKEIRHSDKIQADTNRVRNEWIVNITHDLKTPLSPIKGYAELLSDHPETELQNAQEYASVMLKHIGHTEKLIDDLKLTYQLDSGGVPYHPQRVKIIRYLRELVIDIVNDPVFADRDIAFESNMPEQEVSLDPDLFRRAVQNIIVNALVHNPRDTKVEISVGSRQNKAVSVRVRDNGIGMSETEQAELWNRYYRGTNTKEKTEGSGLGLAIAKQIVLLHDGDIFVESKPGEGTEFVIFLPGDR